MSIIRNTGNITEAMASYDSSSKPGKADKSSKEEKKVAAEKGNQGVNKSKVLGKTIGEPKLSEKAMKYYETLKKKYANADFILVSEEQKEKAKAQAGSYANAKRMVVLIDEAKIEKMAKDEKYRAQYEGIIANATSGLSQLQSSISTTGADVKTFGAQINNDGTASYFAVLKNSNDTYKNIMEKKAEKKKEDKKVEEKRAAKKEAKEKIEKKREEKQKVEEAKENTITITASSAEELIRKIQDYVQNSKSDMVQTEEEKGLGQHIDFRG